MSDAKKFITGIPGLDKLIGEVEAPYTLLVAGHPGSGKTTLATTVCYANALQGRKCLYVTFYEDRGRFFKFMKRLGLDLESVESKGLLRFVKVPQVLSFEQAVEGLSKIVTGEYDVVVIDTITSLLENVKESAEKRAWLLNYFYQLPIVLDNFLILIAELPFGEEKLSLDPIEFVSDATLLLKHKIEDGFLTRIVEVRKVRGAPVHVAETYFTIAEGMGVVVFTPPVLAELPRESEEVVGFEELMKLAKFRRGYVINVFYPPEPGAGLDALLLALAIAIKNDMRTLIVSYTNPDSVLREALKNKLMGYGLSGEKADKLLDKHVTIAALNPFAYSLTQLIARELTIIERAKPDIVVFWGVHIPSYVRYVDELKELFNELMYLKSRNVTTIRVGSCLNEDVCNAETAISDITLRFVRVFRKDGSIDTRLYVYERFKEPVALPSKAIAEFVRSCGKVLKELAGKL